MEIGEKDRKSAKKLLLLAALTGELMLKNGAETYRVEDTVERICNSRKKIQYTSAFVTPTGIFVSLEYYGEMMTYLVRVKSIKIDLNKIDLINEFSREFVSSNMSIDDGLKKIKQISQVKGYSKTTKTLFGALASAFFTLLFGGNAWDFVSAYIVSAIVLLIINKIDKYKMTFFVNNLIGASIVTILTVFSIHIGIGKNMDSIIIGSIMPLVPGVPIANALRDTISGDFISGLSRSMESIFSALAIAFGVGIVLNIYYKGLF